MNVTMADLHEARERLRQGTMLGIRDGVLITLAAEIRNPPAKPSDCCDWAEREAVPLINELGFRLQASTRWYAPQTDVLITGEGLQSMGFRLDESFGHPVFILEAREETPGCHTSLHLLPHSRDGWIAEIHNWQTNASGERECGPDQRVSLPRLLMTYVDVRRLCAVISTDWLPAYSSTP